MKKENCICTYYMHKKVYLVDLTGFVNGLNK